MGKKEAKTNAIRILETMKIPYEARTYECDDFVDAAQIADKLGLDHAGMYKTITTVGKSGGYYVFVVLYKRWLYVNRHEKAVSYIYP